MKVLVVAAMLLVGSGVAMAHDTEAARGEVCWYGGKAYQEGEQIEAGWVDELGQHLTVWTCRDGRWQ